MSALKKMSGNWVDNLHRALWADRVTVKRVTGETLAFLVCGKEHILPIELSILTWQTLPWDTVTDTASLLELRTRQFEKRDERLRESISRTVRLRDYNKEYFDDSKVLRPNVLQEGDLVLLRDSYHENDRTILTKFLPKWQGPFKILKKGEKGWYNLCELDGTPFRNHTPGHRLKKFVQRTQMDLKEIEERILQDVTSEPETFTEDHSEEAKNYGQDIPTRRMTRQATRQRIEEESATKAGHEDGNPEKMQTRKIQEVRPIAPPGFDRSQYLRFD